jgi:hypothetical protein
LRTTAGEPRRSYRLTSSALCRNADDWRNQGDLTH